MGLTAAFNAQYRAVKNNDYVLSVHYEASGYDNILTFDFMARVMIMRTSSHGDGGAVVTPFSQLDRDTLVEFREKLIELKGNPPELSPEKPAVGQPGNKFNL
ncbi:MAG: hypothetical protein ACAH80_09010 [Alphaproteobacteria bacterium]